MASALKPPDTQHVEGTTSGSEATGATVTKQQREWMMVATGLAIFLSIIAIVISLFALGERTSSSRSAASSSAAAPSAATVPALPVKRITLASRPDYKTGSDGKKHDAFVPATDLRVAAGQKVQLTVLNYDDMPHSFTSPGLAKGAAIPVSMQQHQGTRGDLKVMPMPGIGVDQMLAPATGKTPGRTTFTFTAPKKAGTYFWYCKMPCDPWAMTHDGYMRGTIIVT